MSWFSRFKKWNKLEQSILGEGESKLTPESKWIVVFDDNEICSTDYEKNQLSMKWTEIREIIINTNDSGPWGTDLWWKVISQDKLLLIPNGATGENEIMKRFQRLPDFNNESMISAMQSTRNAEFLVWKLESHS